MAITEREWQDSLMENKSRQKQERDSTIGLLKQAAVDAQYLTGRDEWDKYLRMLQDQRNATQNELTALHASLGTPLTDERVRLAYVAINVITERLRILDWCMGLPKQICEEAAQVTA